MRSNKIVSQLLGNWTESDRKFEKHSRDWESAEESFKLEIEKLENEKVESRNEIEREWQKKMTEKEEEMEALIAKLHSHEKENERIKVEVEDIRENLENEKNHLIVEKEGLLAQVNETQMKLGEKEQELIVLKEDIEKASERVQQVTEEKQRLESVVQELELTVAQTKEEIDRLQLDVDVLQNERNHFEQRLFEDTKRSGGHFQELFEIIGNGEEIQDAEQAKARLPELLSGLVRQLRESKAVEENIKEEKARVCNEIRQEFETALLEKEGILEELRVKLKNTHLECDDVKKQNHGQKQQIENLEDRLSTLRSELKASKAQREGDISARSGDSVDEIATREVIEEHFATPSVVEETMTATSSDPLMADQDASCDVESPAKDNQSVKLQLESLNNELGSLTDENAGLKEQLEKLQILYSERNLQTAGLAGENETLKDLVQTSSLKNSQLGETNERLRREVEQLQLQNENLLRENNRNAEQSAGENLEVDSLKAQLNDFSAQVDQLKAELSQANIDRAAYGKLRRDFDHIVSGLRGDLERTMADRNNTARMLDNMRAQVHEKAEQGATEDKDEHDKDIGGHAKDKDRGTQEDKKGRSLKEVETELEGVRHQLREMTLVNRQLKQLGKSLDAELKGTRKDKQHAEKKCQDLRDEMERFVKEKEAIIVESRERIETSEKVHQEKLHEVHRLHQEELDKATERSEYKELISANEELRMKLNDAYEELNRINQLEESNISLKEEIDELRSENVVLTSKVEELKNAVDEAARQLEKLRSENDVLREKAEELESLVDEADKQIELRDGKISELNKSIQESKETVRLQSEKTPETKTVDDVANAYNDVIIPQVVSQVWQDPEEHELVKAVNSLELGQKPGEESEIIEYRPEMTSESEKLERELIQTSGQVTENQVKFMKEELEREGRDRSIVEEELQKERQEHATAVEELQKTKKISQKLKTMLKNSRTAVETLNGNLSQAKEEVLEKEQSLTTLRNEMAEIVSEKEEIVENLMSKVKDIELQNGERLNNLESKHQGILSKRDLDIERLSKELSIANSRGDELKGQLDMWRQSYNEVIERANVLENETEVLKHSLQDSIVELNQSKEAGNRSQESIKELNEQLRRVIEDKDNSDRQRSDVQANLVAIKGNLEQTIDERDAVIESLRAEIETAEEHLQNVNDALELQKSFNEDSLGRIEEDQVKLNNLQNEMNTSLSEKDNIIQQLEDELEKANESFHDIAQRLQVKTVEYGSLSTEKDSLHEQLKETLNESQNTSTLKEGIIAETGRNLEMANNRAEGLTEQLNDSLNVLESERKRREELDDIASTLRQDLQLRTEQKRELEDVVMALNIDLEKALKDREELRQALRVKQTVTQATDNPCFDEIVLEEKTKVIQEMQQQLSDTEHKLDVANDQLVIAKKKNESLESELKAAEVSTQEITASAHSEKQRLEEVVPGLKADLQQSSLTKEEAINVLRKKLEEAVEERGGAVVSLKSEYDKMLGERDQVVASLQDEMQRVNEEFTNLGYRFELTLQDNVSKGNSIVQLQNQVQEKQHILDENNELQERLRNAGERMTELDREIHELKEDKNRRDFEKLELQNSQNKVLELEKRMAANMKDGEVSKAKQKKEFKRLYEGLQFDLENSRKQNLEKEKSLQNLREELEEVMKQKEALAYKLRNPNKERGVERFQKSDDADFVEKFRDEKKELLRDLDKTRKEKDDIFAKFHNISEGLRRDLEMAINSRDEKAQECLKANVVIDKLQRSNAELEREIKERDATINSLNSGIETKHTESSTAVEQLWEENKKLKSNLAQESMNARQEVLKTQNTNEELRQSLAKAEYDRENLRNYVASKEVQNEELKRQLQKEIAERKRLAEQRRVEALDEVVVSSSAQEYDAMNQTRTDLDEVREIIS